tara:strand:+ start:4183 stop:4881 length:699 start_codon:yes stop_codon:yes gene_type:complete
MKLTNVTKKAVVLLSGGLDSTTVLAIAREKGFEVHALSFDYAQRHSVELDLARTTAKRLGVVEHRIVKLDLSGGSALNDNIDVPKNRTEEEISLGIPKTYVPARNTIFLAHALGYAEIVGASDLFLGVNAIDYSGYPDCRPEYISAFEALAKLATRVGVEENSKFRIHVPLIELTKVEIIREGLRLGVDFGITHSCYDPSPEGIACGACDSCLLRLKGFLEAGMEDPATYQT